MASLVLFTSDAFCTSSPQQKLAGASSEGLISMILALFFVVFVIIAIAWFAKKLNLTPVGANHFKLVSSMSLGGRERIVIVEVQGEQHAIGVTNQSVNHLFKLEQNITQEKTEFADNQMLQRINKLFGFQAPKAKNKDS